MEHVFHQFKVQLEKLPYKEAIVYEDALLHTAALLPHYREGFGWLYELTKITYNSTGHEDNLFLYLLSIAGDPDFDKPGIRQKILYEIGCSYYNIGDYGKAQVTLEKFIGAYDMPPNRDQINGLTILGLISQNQRNFNDAAHYLNLALEKATAARDTEWVALAGGNIGALYLDMGNVSDGLPFIYKDIGSGLKMAMYESVANDYFDLSNIALKEGKLQWAKLALDSALILLNLDNQRYRKAWARTYQNLARYHKASGQPDSAYHYQVLAQRITDSLQNGKNQALLRLRVSAFTQEKEDGDALLLKASQESSRMNRRFAILSAIGTLLVAGFAALYIRQKKRVNSMLREKAGLVEEQRKKEETANHAKDRLFSLIAHDLRGPIGSLKMLLEMMQDGSMSKEQFEGILPEAANRVNNLYKVTDNLLVWAYSQIGGISARKEVVEVGSVINNVFGLLKADAEKKAIGLQTAIPTGLTVTADPDHLELVLRNLVSNALKFAPKGSVIMVDGAAHAKETIIRVIDNGPGLPEVVIRNLRQGDFSSPATGTAGEKGAGLGLVMCNEFIELNGGVLQAGANTPKGTVFTIIFPLH